MPLISPLMPEPLVKSVNDWCKWHIDKQRPNIQHTMNSNYMHTLTTNHVICQTHSVHWRCGFGEENGILSVKILLIIGISFCIWDFGGSSLSWISLEKECRTCNYCSSNLITNPTILNFSGVTSDHTRFSKLEFFGITGGEFFTGQMDAFMVAQTDVYSQRLQR